MSDLLIRASSGSSRVELAAMSGTELVRQAGLAHGITGTSLIALGRLLIATALVGLTRGRPGVTSIQILSQSRLQQVYADVTEIGWLRGYVKNPALAAPILRGEGIGGRRTIGPVIHPGQVSVVRMGEQGEYVQSATPLEDGEVDTDVEAFLLQSEQVPAALRADVLVNEAGEVVAAGGVLVRALPDSDPEALIQLIDRTRGGAVTKTLENAGGAERLLESICRGAVENEPRLVPVWRCRCSREKVLSTLGLLDVMELAAMVIDEQPVEVRCELCNTVHRAEPPELEAIMKAKTLAES